MKIIELNGLPGSGKSTLCNKLIEIINEESVITLKDVVKVKNEYNLQNIINFIKILLNYKFFAFNYRILRFSLEYSVNYSNFLFAARLIKFNGNLSFLIGKNPDKVIILDEGFIQYITSIPHNNVMKKNKNLEYIISFILKKYSINYIHCEIDEKTNYSRLRNRNFKGNRFDTLPQDKLEEVLKIKYNNICTLRSLLDINSKGILIDMSEDIEKNIRFIVRKFNMKTKTVI